MDDTGQRLLNNDSDEDEDELNDVVNFQPNLPSAQCTPNKEEIDIDEFLRRAGQSGRYQLILLFWYSLFALTHGGAVLGSYFTDHSPEWRCTNNTLNMSLLPLDSIAVNSTFCKLHRGEVFDTTDTRRCQLNRTEWEYVGERVTVVTEFDLVCKSQLENSMIGSIVFIGWIIGSMIMGNLSDNYGRKKVFFPNVLLMLVMILLQAFITSIWQLLILRFLTGVFLAASVLNIYIILIEQTGPDRRMIMSAASNTGWILGLLIVTLSAYLVKSWRMLIIVISAPYFACLLLYFNIPESARWLNEVGRREEAEEILFRLSRRNGKPMSNVRIQASVQAGTSKSSYLDLFRSWSTLKIILAQSVMWLTSGMGYYGLSLAADGGYGGDMYTDFMLSSLVEIPGLFIASYAGQRFGRRRTGLAAVFLSCIGCLAVALTCFKEITHGVDISNIRIILGTVSKGLISLYGNIMWLWSMEIYPTVVRSQGMTISLIMSRIGASSSPFIMKSLRYIHQSIPFFVLVGMTALSSIVGWFMVETKHLPSREGLQDMKATSD